METNIKATTSGALDGVIRGTLVLLVVLALSWAAINHRLRRIEQRHLKSPAIADPTITETEKAEKEEQKKTITMKRESLSPTMKEHTQQQKADISPRYASSHLTVASRG